MKTLIQTGKCSIIYGDFRGQKSQELFRCPRSLDHIDLHRYINDNRCILKFETDNDTKDLKKSEKYIGYYRLYFKGGWYGRWMEVNQKVSAVDCHGIDEIMLWLIEKFPDGCSWDMKEYLKEFPIWGCENRYLLKPFMSEHYKVLFDTTYGNHDYPVRIYVYG